MINDTSLYASSEDSGHRISSACKDDYDTFYKAEDGCESVDIDISWSHIITAKYLVLKENINLSQRIESFEILNDEGQTIYKGTTVGYKKIAKLGNITTKHLTIRITSSRVCPTLSFLAVY